MRRFYLRLTILLVVTFTLVGMAMSAIGSTQPIHPALRGFVEGCEGITENCWFGIIIGVTPYGDVPTILAAYGFDVKTDERHDYVVVDSPIYPCDFRFRRSGVKVRGVSVLNCEGLLWGDVINLWGFPNRLSPDPCGPVTYAAYVGDGEAWIRGDNFTFLSMHTEVVWIGYDHFPSSASLDSDRNDWYGFVLPWRYRQFHEFGGGCG